MPLIIKNNMIKRLFIFFALIIGLSLNISLVKADIVERNYKKAAQKYHTLYQNSKFREKADNWLLTIKQFQLIYQNYPNHFRAPHSLFNIGKLYRSLYRWNHKSIYLDRSNITFRRLVREYPNSPLSDDAQFLLAENYERYKKDRNLALLEYKKLAELFPGSNAAIKGNERLIALQPSVETVPVKPEEGQATTPMDLTKARFGGLSEAQDQKIRPLVLVSKVDYWSTADWSRMVINIKREVRYKYQVLKEDKAHPQKRLYLDIQHSYIPKGFKNRIASKDGLITQARIGQFNKQTVRIVLDMVSLKKIKIFHFKLPNQYKIVIDILGKTERKPAQLIGKRPKIVTGKEDQPDRDLSLSKALGLKVRRIIIDPGHGGKDPGASAFNVKEKDIALRISLSLRRIIKKNHPNIKVLMTRNSDRFIKLEARTAYANKNKGDLFLSIHVNASPRVNLSGVETYYLNLTSDAETLALAAKENQTSQKSISELQTILRDLMTNSKIMESKDLAGKVQSSIVAFTKKSSHQLRNLGVKQAPFFVLIGAQMPSILIETGFLTNPQENRFLNTSKYRQVIAEGIYRGIRIYLN